MNLGVAIDKEAVQEILTRLEIRKGFSKGEMGVRQAANAIARLQKPPENLEAASLTVTCPYCGLTPGNKCERGGVTVLAHPSRVAVLFGEKA